MWNRIANLTTQWIDRSIEIKEAFITDEGVKIVLETFIRGDPHTNISENRMLRLGVDGSNLSVAKLQVVYLDKTALNFMWGNNRIETQFHIDWLAIFKHKIIAVNRTIAVNHLSIEHLKYLEPIEIYCMLYEGVTMTEAFSVCNRCIIYLYGYNYNDFQNLDKLKDCDITLMDIENRPNNSTIDKFLLNLDSSNKVNLYINEQLSTFEVQRTLKYFAWCNPKCAFKISYLRSNESQNDIVNLMRTKFSEDKYKNSQYPLADMNMQNYIKMFL
jgi:hypothetical protein